MTAHRRADKAVEGSLRVSLREFDRNEASSSPFIEHAASLSLLLSMRIE